MRTFFLFMSVTVLEFCCLAACARQVNILQPATLVRIERPGVEPVDYAAAKLALAAAQPGDVIILGPGTHRGPLVVSTSGLTLRGLDGARIDGNNADWRPQWQPAPDIAPYAYVSPIDFEPGAMTIDGRIMLRLEESRGAAPVLRNGVGRAGRTALQSVFMYQPDKHRVIISFAEDVNPNGHVIAAAPDGSAALTVRGADHCTVENLIVTGGIDGIRLEQTADSTIRNCLIYAVDVGVHLYKGATRCRVLRCDISWNPDALNMDSDRTSGLAADDVWMAHKKFGTYDKWGVLIDQADSGNEVAFNYIYNVWDGIENGDGLDKGEVRDFYTQYVFAGKAPYNQGLLVHHNRIDLTLDDALECGNELVDSQWHANVVTRARCAARLKTISMGPFYFYDNVLRDCSDGLRLYKSVPASAKVYIYNNLVQHSTGIIYHAMESVCWDDPWLKRQIAPGTPGFRIFNNLFICDTQFGNHSEKDIEPNFKADYNVYTAPPNAALVLRDIDAHSLFHLSDADVKLDGKHAALVDPSQLKSRQIQLAALDVPTPLPGWDQADADAHPGPRASEVDQTPTGPNTPLWKIVASQLQFGEKDNSQYALSPLRWLEGKQLEFQLIDLKAGQELGLLLACSGRAPGSQVHITIRNADDTVLREWRVAGDGAMAHIPVDHLLPTTPTIRVMIDDAKSAQWRVQIVSGSGRVAVDATKDLPLRKYDGGAYVLDYPVTDAAAASFSVLGANLSLEGSRIVIVRLDGTSEPLAPDGRVMMRGQTGTYRIEYSFVKKGTLRIEGPTSLVIIDEHQPVVHLRQWWGKPSF